MHARTLIAAVVAACLAPAPSLAQGTAKVKLAVLTDMSSVFSSWAGKGSVIATEMAVEDFKRTPEGRGITAEVVSADFQLKPDLAVAITKKWLEEGATAIVDVPLSAAALALTGILRGSKAVGLLSGPLHDDLTTRECSPNHVHWTVDTSSITRSTTGAIAQAGGKRWFTIRQDAVGAKLQEEVVRKIVAEHGGSVVGTVVTPMGTADFSSALLHAQSSGAQVVGLVQGGADMVNSVKQAKEYAIMPNQQVTISFSSVQDIKALGLPLAQGLLSTEGFYWDADEGTRAFARRFTERNGGVVPSAAHAGAYSATLHYLKAVAAANTTDGPQVVAKMKTMPVTDPVLGPGTVRADGRMVHDLYLLQVKTPAESKSAWDVYKVVKKVPGNEAFRPMSTACSLVK